MWQGHALNPIWFGDCQPPRQGLRASLCQIITHSLKPSPSPGPLIRPFRRESRVWMWIVYSLLSRVSQPRGKGARPYIPVSSLPGDEPLRSPWSAAILLLKTTKQTPLQDPLAQREAARSLTLQGRDEVSHWQDVLRSQDGSPCQGLFVCLQERLSWHSTKIAPEAGTQGLPLPVPLVQNWVSRKKNCRERENILAPVALTLPLYYFISCINSYIISHLINISQFFIFALFNPLLLLFASCF